MRNIIVALAMLAVFAIAAIASGTTSSVQQKADCTKQSCPMPSCCSGCESACK